MTVKAGKDVVLKLTDGGGVERTLSAYVLKIRMSLKGKELQDVTTAGQSGHVWASNELEDVSFVVDFMYDPTTDTGPWAVLTSLRTITTAKAFEIGPQGSTAGYPKITGSCFLEDLPMEVAVGDMIKLTGVPFKVSGVATVGAYSA